MDDSWADEIGAEVIISNSKTTPIQFYFIPTSLQSHSIYSVLNWIRNLSSKLPSYSLRPTVEEGRRFILLKVKVSFFYPLLLFTCACVSRSNYKYKFIYKFKYNLLQIQMQLQIRWRQNSMKLDRKTMEIKAK